MRMAVVSRIRSVTAPAAASVGMVSWLPYTTRSSVPRLAKPAASASRAQPSTSGPVAVGMVEGSPIPMSMIASLVLRAVVALEVGEADGQVVDEPGEQPAEGPAVLVGPVGQRVGDPVEHRLQVAPGRRGTLRGQLDQPGALVERVGG